jgi:hypothetical protein
MRGRVNHHKAQELGEGGVGGLPVLRGLQGTPARGHRDRVEDALGRRVDHRDRAAEHRTDVDAAAVGGV